MNIRSPSLGGGVNVSQIRDMSKGAVTGVIQTMLYSSMFDPPLPPTAHSPQLAGAAHGLTIPI